MRTIIYARYSSHLQNSRSTADQVADCRARAEREGWAVVGVFADDAISGAAGIDEAARPQLAAALAMIEEGKAEQLLTESTDRLARHQGDAYAIRERLDFAGARLFTLLDGVVDDITGTIKGLFDARFRKDLGARIKRGQRGTVAQGRLPAGLAYGYRKANCVDAGGNFVRGLREIDADEAAVVLRIFTDYAAGKSPRAIAGELNRDRIPPPRGKAWRATTIAGDRERQNGMLQNRLYAGMIVHNRTSKVTDPRTRKTRIRPNPESEWVSEPAEHLRIVPEILWEAVQAKRSSFEGVQLHAARRPRHLLSGLAVCGDCGGGFTVYSNSFWRCGLYQDGRGCSNNRSIKTELLEQRVLGGIEHQLLHPDVVEAVVLEYHRDFAQRSREIARSRSSLQKRHAEEAAKVERLVRILSEGGGEFAELREALAAAKAERDALGLELAELEGLNVVPLHPRIAEAYRSQVASLTAALASPEGRLEAVPILRGLVERVVISPSAAEKGVEIEVRGRLASILALAGGKGAAEAAPPRTVSAERVKGIEPSS